MSTNTGVGANTGDVGRGDGGHLRLEDIDIVGGDEYPPNKSILLHGPPGTGKTTNAAARVAHLKRDYGYPLDQIAWATYRRSLADETLDRLAKWDVVPDHELDNPMEGATRYFSTFHAIANRCVSNLPSAAGVGDRIRFCKAKGIRYGGGKSWETMEGQELFSYFDWMKENLLDPADPEWMHVYPNYGQLREHCNRDLADLWNEWTAYKKREEVIDFHEQLEAAIRQRACPTENVLVIDEYHDATPLMAKLAEMWMDAAEIVIVAGDPHQVVNSYQGASPHFFERLEERYPRILLNVNWRNGRNHWGPARRMLSRAHTPPDVEPTGVGEIIVKESPRFERSKAAQRWIGPSPNRPGSPPVIINDPATSDDIMFLVRTRVQADGVGAALDRAGIIYRSQKDIRGWNTGCGATRLHLYNALKKIEGVRPDTFDDGGQDGLRSFGGGANYGPAADIDPDTTFLASDESVALLAHTPAEYLAESRTDTKTACDEIDSTGVPLTLTDFAQHVTLEFWGVFTDGARSEAKFIKAGRNDDDRRALRNALQANDGPIDPSEIGPSIMTIHAAKGAEATDVVLYDGITKTIEKRMLHNAGTRANEYRTWYVAMTRASERLHVLRNGFNWMIPFIPDAIFQSGMCGASGGDRGRDTADTEGGDHV